MAVTYRDYYETLGVKRTASQEEIRKAYRSLARKFHPDVNKNKDAEARFKQVAEAHEVLGDPEKRKKYDALGANWQAGQDFTPPPGWENAHFEFRGAPDGGGMDAEGLDGFSSFFESIFGSAMGGQPSERRGRGRPGRGRGMWGADGEDHEAHITISLEEAAQGARKTISLQRARGEVKTYDVSIPAGVTDGARIRLSGQGGAGAGGRAGDLYLHVQIAPHPHLRVNGRDLETDVTITPWEAALGAKVPVTTLSGKVALAIPPGTQSGQRLRLRGKGFAATPQHAAGDFFAVVRIAVPHPLSAKEKQLFEELARASTFNPRQ